MRNRHTKRLVTAVGVLGATGALAAACTAHELPLPADIGPNESVSIAGADPSGRYVLGTLYGGPGLLWVDGELEAKLTGLPDLDGYIDFQGVNGSGVVVAVTEPGNDGYTPWKYENGEYTVLGGGANWVEDINENGDIVGTISNERTIVWPGGDPDAGRELPGNRTANAISEEGVVVGPSGNASATYDGTTYYWPDFDSDRRLLENPAGVETSFTNDVAGDWVIGYDTDNGDGIRWNLADGTVEKLPSYPASVNSDGDIGTAGKIHLADGGTLDLPAPAGSTSTPSVFQVTERGSEYVAVGEYEASKDVYRPVTWTC